MSGPPALPPIGLQLTRTSRVVAQAFERAMAAAGGSVPTWQVLLIVRSGEWSTQSRIAKALGITEATLTHHLNALERQGLVRRWREDANRRVQRVALTDEGEAVFERLREVAIRHDARLRGTLAEDEVTRLAELLAKLEAGLAGSADAGP